MKKPLRLQIILLYSQVVVKIEMKGRVNCVWFVCFKNRPVLWQIGSCIGCVSGICDLGDLELGQEKDIIIRAENTGEYDVSFSKAEMFGSCSNFESRGTVIPSGGFLDLKLKLKTPTVLAQSGGAQNKLTLEKQEAKNQLIEVVFIFYVGTGTEVRHRSYCVVCYYRHW